MVEDRDARIAHLTGQLYDRQGRHLAEENAGLRGRVAALGEKTARANGEKLSLRRFLGGARATSSAYAT